MLADSHEHKSIANNTLNKLSKSNAKHYELLANPWEENSDLALRLVKLTKPKCVHILSLSPLIDRRLQAPASNGKVSNISAVWIRRTASRSWGIHREMEWKQNHD